MAAHNLPTELWRRIFYHATVGPDALHSGLSIGAWVNEPWDASWNLHNRHAAAQQTRNCIVLTCRWWYQLAAEYLWTYLILDDYLKLVNALAQLERSYNGQDGIDRQKYPIYPKPNGGMGWYVRRIDVDFDREPNHIPSMETIQLLCKLLNLCPNIEIFSDCSEQADFRTRIHGPAHNLLPYIFRQHHSRLRRVDWLSGYIVPFSYNLNFAQNLEALNLHHFEESVIGVPISHALYLSLPRLRYIVLREHRVHGHGFIVSTWSLPSLQIVLLELGGDFGAHDFLINHGPKIHHLALHTPAEGGGTYPPFAPYFQFCPNLKTFHFQLHHPTFVLLTPLPSLTMIGIHGLLAFDDRDYDDNEQDQLHNHLTAMVRVRNQGRIPALKIIRLVDFNPVSWNFMERDLQEVAKWQRWQLRWDLLRVEFQDHAGDPLRVPQHLLDLIEQRDQEESEEDTEVEDDYEYEGSVTSTSMSSVSNMSSLYSY